MTDDPRAESLSALEEYDRLMAGESASPDAEAQEITSTRLPAHDDLARPDGMYRFFAGQGISADTVDAIGCYVHAYDGVPAMVFPYTDAAGRLTARTYRPNKVTQILLEPGSRPALFHQGGALDAPADAPCILAENELDAARFIDAGYQYATCAPPGLLERALAGATGALKGTRRFILALTADRAREEVARRLGRHRCWNLVWPAQTPSCFETWQAGGRDALIHAVENAEPWPLDGVQVVRDGLLEKWRDTPPAPVLTTGTHATDNILRMPSDGRLLIITGIPSHGKTSWTKAVMVHQMQHHGRKFIVFSPESTPWESFVADCAALFIGKPVRRRKGAKTPPMADAELAHAGRWLRSRLLLLTIDAENQAPTLDWIFDRAATEILRWGMTDLVIDPWNELEHARGNMSIEEYIGRCLQRCKGFANRHGVNVWIIAHPIKLSPPKPGQKVLPPSLYDISGGAMWSNKADVGIVIHTEDDETQVIVRKLRFAQLWGDRRGIARIVMDRDTGRYQSSPSTPAPSSRLFDD